MDINVKVMFDGTVLVKVPNLIPLQLQRVLAESIVLSRIRATCAMYRSEERVLQDTLDAFSGLAGFGGRSVSEVTLRSLWHKTELIVAAGEWAVDSLMAGNPGPASLQDEMDDLLYVKLKTDQPDWPAIFHSLHRIFESLLAGSPLPSVPPSTFVAIGPYGEPPTDKLAYSLLTSSTAADFFRYRFSETAGQFVEDAHQQLPLKQKDT